MGLEGGLSRHERCFMHAVGLIVCHVCSNEDHDLVRLKPTYVRSCMIKQLGIYCISHDQSVIIEVRHAEWHLDEQRSNVALAQFMEVDVRTIVQGAA